MSVYSDLEIAFRKRDEHLYSLSFRFNSHDDAAEQRSAVEPVISLDLAALVARAGDDAEAYSQALSAAFFTQEVGSEFLRFLAIAQTLQSTLRVRLTIGPDAVELHGVHWETLLDPAVSGAHLFTGDCIVSRFLSSGNDWRPVRLRPRATLRALVAVANPAYAASHGLAPVDVEAERALAARALSGTMIENWPTPAIPLGDLAARLRDDFDILYLVCHGCLVDNEPRLYLAEGPPVSGIELVQAIRELPDRPRMIVLASCQSAGKCGVGLAGLGPRLAEAGVPAVIAMQGDVFMSTAAAFMERFFSELLVDGQIDRAMAVARGQVLKADDYWAPVLFLRLRDGCLWYSPGFGGAQSEEFDKWRSICNSIRSGRFIPILGPELGEDLFGGSEELARQLADQHAYPLASYERLDLAKVTQYISVEQKRTYVLDAIQNEFLRQIARRFTPPGCANPSLGSLLEAAVEACRSDPNQPFRILSDLPAAIYLNASYHSILLHVLKAQGKNPEPVFASWRGDNPQKPQPAVTRPTPDNPWVYHIFGIFGKPDSLVLTEDDFFDYLIATSRLDLLLPALTGQLMQSSLLVLGFRLDDWRFRVLFRMIVTCQGIRTLRELSHVGVQLDPSEWDVADAGKARRYIESYFQGSDNAPDISIYWGSSADFLRQLRDQLAQTADQSPAPVAQGDSNEWF